ncbi:MAG: WYL domain-containing protein [Nitrospirae bacterium]|nr:WYL domain-containing protein [Nitrospirota bacterium]
MTPRRRGRRPGQYSHSKRLSLLLRILSSRKAVVSELADELDVTRRQIKRDLAQIEADGHPLTKTEEAGEHTWHLPLNYRGLPPIELTPCEVMALYLARAHMSHLEQTPLMDDLDSVFQKIKASLPAKTINHLERIVQVFSPIPRPLRPYAKHKAVLAELRKPLLLQRRVVVHHQTPDNMRPVSHLVDPYALALFQNGLYLVGFSHRAKAMRTFAVERIHKVEPTDEQFSMPPGFSADDMNRRLFGLFGGPMIKARVWFSSDIAHYFAERGMPKCWLRLS